MQAFYIANPCEPAVLSGQPVSLNYPPSFEGFLWVESGGWRVVCHCMWLHG